MLQVVCLELEGDEKDAPFALSVYEEEDDVGRRELANENTTLDSTSAHSRASEPAKGGGYPRIHSSHSAPTPFSYREPTKENASFDCIISSSARASSMLDASLNSPYQAYQDRLYVSDEKRQEVEMISQAIDPDT